MYLQRSLHPLASGWGRYLFSRTLDPAGDGREGERSQRDNGARPVHGLVLHSLDALVEQSDE